MMRRLAGDPSGATAIEFALTVPIFLLLMIATLQVGVAIQRWNALHSVAADVARCIAIASPRCTDDRSNTSAAPEIDYAIRVAAAMGLGTIAADQVDTAVVTASNGDTYRQVTVTTSASMLGQDFGLRASASYPTR